MSNEYQLKVGERPLTQRINKILARENHKLFKSRTDSEKLNLGDWYIAGIRSNAIISIYCELEKVGRETGALTPHECIGEES